MQFEPNFVSPGVLPVWLDVGAVALGAVYGATVANSRKAPLIGVLLMGVLLGFGGGIIRDIFLNTSINALTHGRYVTTAVVASLIGALLGDRLMRPLWVFLTLDALVMGLFVVIGTEKAVLFGMPTSSAIFIGTLAAIGGGIFGDVLMGRTPDVMTRGPWQASVALACAIWYVIWAERNFVQFAEISTLILAVGIRGMSLWRGWDAPTLEPINPKIIRKAFKSSKN